MKINEKPGSKKYNDQERNKNDDCIIVINNILNQKKLPRLRQLSFFVYKKFMVSKNSIQFR
ncbi:hypothetical protein SAMN05444371_2783 [Epilithonimonas mollis]|uniref:Uncharacterized protein n=1 Tax=Epilithonimonas mollis TaxID=216903 RepID=A0A1M6TC60_9FLAO|nr:hypothetical protein SAMN05444371_2783 [Epilithonimonas mollis]